MRRILIFLWSVCWCLVIQAQQTVLTGSVKNYGGELVRIELPNGWRDTINVKSDGSYRYQTQQIKGACQLLVRDHEPNIPLYFQTGDKQQVNLTLSGNTVTAAYDGKRKAEVATLREMQTLNDRSIWDWDKIAKMSFGEYSGLLEKERAKCNTLLAEVKDPVAATYLRNLLTLTLNKKLMLFETINSYYNKKRLDENSDFGQCVKSIPLDNPDVCDTDLLESILTWYLRDKETDQEKWNLNLFDEAKKRVGNPAMVDALMAETIQRYINFNSSEDYSPVMKKFEEYCSDRSLYNRMKGEYDEYVRALHAMDAGMPAHDFEMIDTEGNKVRLSDLRGKLLYLDLWGTWCAPCIAAMPRLAALQEHFKDEPRIMIISISQDPNIDTWKRFLAKKNPTWKQYIVDKKNNDLLDKEYRVYGIPRFIIIDKDGKFVDAQALGPGAEGMKEYLEELLDPKPYDGDALLERVYKQMRVDTIKTADEYYKLIFPMIHMTVMNKNHCEQLKADVMQQLFKMSESSDPKEYLNYYLRSCCSDSLRQVVMDGYQTYLKNHGHLFAGKEAPDFTFTDTKGKLKHLKDFRGQLLLIDIWGTWCAPCIEEMPFIDALQQKYGHRDDVRIMSIACDKKEATWKAFLKKRKPSWSQYLVTSEGDRILNDVYHVIGIPRFIIIDKEGRFISADAMRPSFEEFNAYFEKLLNN